MPSAGEYVEISGDYEETDFLWLNDTLGYNPLSNTAFNIGTNSKDNFIKATDSQGNSLDKFEDITGYEGEIVGIDNYGNVVGYDGMEFVIFDADNRYSISERKEREWGISNPIGDFIENRSNNGPWIAIREGLDGYKDSNTNPDLSKNTIIDNHAAKRWSERSNLSYDNIVKELSASKIHPVPEGEELDELDFIRRNPESGLIFPQKGNRIITTLPRLDMMEDPSYRQKYRNFFNTRS